MIVSHNAAVLTSPRPLWLFRGTCSQTANFQVLSAYCPGLLEDNPRLYPKVLHYWQVSVFRPSADRSAMI